MPTLTIRQVDEKTKSRLRVRAAHHGRSMEAEAREILRIALNAGAPGKENLVDKIRRRMAPLGGVDLQLPERDAIRRPPVFAK
jgi:plasmid stability protein